MADLKPPLAILGLGTALPGNAVSQARAAEIAVEVFRRTRAPASSLSVYPRSGVATRHSVLEPATVLSWLGPLPAPFLPDPVSGPPAGRRGATTGERMKLYREKALPLALRAARAALESSGVAPAEITHLITVSCTGFAAPGVDIGLLRGLALPPTVERAHLGFMGCHGAINGLRVAQAFASADPAVRLLLCAVELCSLHYHYGSDPEKLVGNALFADGAAALVAAPARAEPAGAGPGGAWRVVRTGSCLFPGSEEAMTWMIGDHGFEMSLSRRVPELIRSGLLPWLRGWLAEERLAIGEVRSWAVHPGGPRILSAVEESLGLPSEATRTSREVLSSCGNMSSPTVLFILERLRREMAPRPCLVLGFGPGLVVEGALIL